METLYRQIENSINEKHPELDFKLIECIECDGYKIVIVDPSGTRYTHTIRSYDDFLNLIKPILIMKQK